jgi:hypothetical protein
MNEPETDEASGTPVTQARSRRVRKDVHEERREREAWALEVVRGMRKSPSAPEALPRPLQPTHLPGINPEALGFVYFAYCAGRIKIGYSTDVANRMAGLASNSPAPVTLLMTIRGDEQDEAAYHEMFAADRVHREWFLLSPDLREFMESKFGHETFPLLFEAEHP